jgi:hypothetical protein
MGSKPASYEVLLTQGTVGRQVIIYLIVDSRRDMQSVLARRLLGA